MKRARGDTEHARAPTLYPDQRQPGQNYRPMSWWQKHQEHANRRPQPPTEDAVNKEFERIQRTIAEYERADQARKAARTTASLEERVKLIEAWMDSWLNASCPPAETREQVKERMTKQYEQEHLEWEDDGNEGVVYR